MVKAFVAEFRQASPPADALIRIANQLLERVAPNWFAAVMGTGIVATSAAGLRPPDGLPAGITSTELVPFAIAVWMIAVCLLVGIGALSLLQWIRRRDLAVGHHGHPVIAHFYGAPSMAVLTVGAGTLLLGKHVVGVDVAVQVDWVLWVVGTLLGLISSVTVPYLLFTGQLGERATKIDAAFGGWLMPVVPPMVSASTGALLLPFCPAGEPRLTMILACYAMFGLSLISSLIIITLIWARLARHGMPEPRLVPTLWIVLGPLGQSVTAAALLGEGAHEAIGDPFATGMRALGLIFGVPVFGFAVFWAILAAALTLRTARGHGLPFAPTWWAFTFPIGTCVTGASGLASLSGANAFRILAGVLFVSLVAAWGAVSVRALQSVRTWGTRGPTRSDHAFRAPSSGSDGQARSERETDGEREYS